VVGRFIDLDRDSNHWLKLGIRLDATTKTQIKALAYEVNSCGIFSVWREADREMVHEMNHDALQG
jgi:hypothetical protein